MPSGKEKGDSVMNIWTFVGIVLPLLGTALGAACVFVLRGSLSERVNKALLGFASGVMVAASVWSLLIPSMEHSAQLGRLAFAPAAGGFLLGMAFLLALDRFVPHLHMDCDEPEGPSCRLGKSAMMMLAVTLHNIPEGMAVGLAFAVAAQDGLAGLAGACALALGIGIQNFPEGAAISLPLRQSGMSRGRSFAYGVLSGAVEPLFGAAAALAAGLAAPSMPWLMTFAAGAMMWVVFAEMLPHAAARRDGALAAAVGYLVMMALDIALG